MDGQGYIFRDFSRKSSAKEVKLSWYSVVMTELAVMEQSIDFTARS